MDVGVYVAEVVGMDVEELKAVVVRVGRASMGKYSSGLNSSVAFWEYANCVAKVNVEFGLITPIIP